MPEDCHIHIFMNGVDYRQAVRNMEEGRVEEVVRHNLETYRKAGITFLRDGGDHYGASKMAKHLATEYGLDYRTPIFAIHKKGHYGRIVGRAFENWEEYRGLVHEAQDEGADFIKIMISGIVDFDRAALTEESLEADEIAAMIGIAHEEGMAVMAHANGEAVLAAAKWGCDSVEHGYFMPDEAIEALVKSDTVYVPTIVTTKNLLGDQRFSEISVRKTLEIQSEIIWKCYKTGVQMAVGSDAGAYRVEHGRGALDEENALLEILTDENGDSVYEFLENGIKKIKKRFHG